MGKVILVDAYNIIYRAYHGGSKELKNSKGFPTGALYTSLGMFKNIQKQECEYALAVFDGGKNFREEIDADYKANRKPMPEDLKTQMPAIKEGLEVLGWPMLVADGVEADDIIGTLAVRAATAGFDVEIYSGDKDFRALISDKIKIIDTMNKITYDKDVLFEKMGICPEHVRMYLTLKGDGADNVNGVAKVGDKTAAEWCNKYGSIEKLKEHAHEIKGVVGNNLREAISSGSLDKDYSLIGLKLDVPVEINKKMLRFKPIDGKAIYDFAEKYEFKSWMSQDKKNKP